MTAEQALEHPWLHMNDHPTQSLSPELFSSLNEYRQMGALKKAALVTMAYTLTQVESTYILHRDERADMRRRKDWVGLWCCECLLARIVWTVNEPRNCMHDECILNIFSQYGHTRLPGLILFALQTHLLDPRSLWPLFTHSHRSTSFYRRRSKEHARYSKPSTLNEMDLSL